jgi:hypothetical protein
MALEHQAMTERIIGAAIEVHRRLGPGFLESVYEKALIIELRLKAVPAFLPSSCAMSGVFCTKAQPIQRTGASRKCEKCQNPLAHPIGFVSCDRLAAAQSKN